MIDTWKGTREVRTVEEVLTSLRPRYLEGLRAVRFQNHLVKDPASGRAGVGGWRRGFGDILLSRDSGWSWAAEDADGLIAARWVLWHELGHHVYNRHMNASGIQEWLEAQPEPVPPGSGRTEQFAEQFAYLMQEPSDTLLGRFFARFRP